MQYNYDLDPELASKIPGICDFHVHVGEKIGGNELADDFTSLSKVAQVSNIRAIGAFVTEEFGVSLRSKYENMKAAAAEKFTAHVHWHLTPTKADFSEVAELVKEGCDLKFYTTYKEAGLYRSYQEIEMWMLALPQTRFLIHCEDESIIQRHSMRQSFHRPYHLPLRRPEMAEITAVERILDIAIKLKHPVHIVHVSTPKAAELIRDARKDYDFITCETAPHYLIYSEDILREENAHRYFCSPPFRSDASRGQLVEHLQDGVFDIIASDHCPFADEVKDRYKDNLEKVPGGLSGTGILFSSMYHHFVKSGKISLETLISLTCTTPAALMNLPE